MWILIQKHKTGVLCWLPERCSSRGGAHVVGADFALSLRYGSKVLFYPVLDCAVVFSLVTLIPRCSEQTGLLFLVIGNNDDLCFPPSSQSPPLTSAISTRRTCEFITSMAKRTVWM